VSGDLSLTLAFATGLLGALHCLGMCGGIAGGLFVRFGRGRLASPILLFHATRILVYVLLGAAGAALSRVLVQTGLVGKGQGLLMMVAGLVIIAIGLSLAGSVPRRTRADGERRSRSVVVPFPTAPTAAHAWSPAVAGALNGFVPCSLVFSVAVKATATADPLRAGMLMAAFGLGTLPTMGLASLAGAIIGRRATGLLAGLTGLVVVALGLWTLYEGLVFFEVMRGLGNW
jgi:sulfite exporter TauE/SafE